MIVNLDSKLTKINETLVNDYPTKEYLNNSFESIAGIVKDAKIEMGRAFEDTHTRTVEIYQKHESRIVKLVEKVF